MLQEYMNFSSSILREQHKTCWFLRRKSRLTKTGHPLGKNLLSFFISGKLAFG